MHLYWDREFLLRKSDLEKKRMAVSVWIISKRVQSSSDIRNAMLSEVSMHDLRGYTAYSGTACSLHWV